MSARTCQLVRPLFLLVACSATTTILVALGSALVFPTRFPITSEQYGFLSEANVYSRRVVDWPGPPPDLDAKMSILGPRSPAPYPRPRPLAIAETRPGGCALLTTDHNLGEQIGLSTDTFPGVPLRTVEQETWMHTYQHARGWPFPALGTTWDQTGVATIGSGDAAIRIPLIPIWPGFLANGAIFAGAWAVALVGMPILRRWCRARNGNCHACGYDIANLTLCPECGTTRRETPTMS